MELGRMKEVPKIEMYRERRITGALPYGVKTDLSMI
jgi:hypothetical protein